jgi:transposase InsO family protein
MRIGGNGRWPNVRITHVDEINGGHDEPQTTNDDCSSFVVHRSNYCPTITVALMSLTNCETELSIKLK